jgi:catalase
VVPGIGFSPDKMLLGRAFAYADTHRHRIGANYLQLPVNQPKQVQHHNTYTFDGPMAYQHSGDAPVYAPNSEGRGYADRTGEMEESWESDGPMVRQAYTLRADDDDFTQAGTLVREVWDDQQRADFVDNVAGHLLGGVKGEVLERAFGYWKNVDEDTGARIEAAVRARVGGTNPGGEDAQARAEAADAPAETDTQAATPGR